MQQQPIQILLLLVSIMMLMVQLKHHLVFTTMLLEEK